MLKEALLHQDLSDPEAAAPGLDARTAQLHPTACDEASVRAADARAARSHGDDHDVPLTPFLVLRYLASTGLLAFSATVVAALMFAENTRVARQTHPWVALVATIAALGLLSVIQGQQAALVGLAAVDPEAYRDTHPLTYRSAQVAFRGDNLRRYLAGRQLMVILAVFVINQCCVPLDPTADVLGLPDGVKFVFLDLNVGVILVTCVVGQLATQVAASHCMIDFLNNRASLFALYAALAFEASGVLHASYLVHCLTGLCCEPVPSSEAPRGGCSRAFFCGRVLLSLALLGFSLAVTFAALLQGKTQLNIRCPGVPPGAAVCVLLFCLCLVGTLEGMKIAFYSVAKLPAAERGTSPFGRRTCALLFEGNGQHLPGFMIGRQLAVAATFFLVAAITSLHVAPGAGDNLFGASDGAQAFLEYGFTGALVTSVLACVTWELAAHACPAAFLNSPVTHVLLRAALALERTGLCDGARVLALVARTLARLQYDEVYLGNGGAALEPPVVESTAKHAPLDDTLSTHLDPGEDPPCL